MVLVPCMSSNVDWYLHEVSWRYLEQVSSYRADTILWKTDRQTPRGKTIGLPSLKGEDIMSTHETFSKSKKTTPLIASDMAFFFFFFYSRKVLIFFLFLNKNVYCGTFFFFFFFWFGFYGPFKNISLISSRSFIEGGRKPENPEKNHLTIRKQNLAFPHMTRARLEPQRWET